VQKDFDQWNIHKKYIHNIKLHKFYHERDIWWCSLGTNIGFEQDGKGDGGERPVLIVKGFSKNVCFVVPLTTSTKTNLYHVLIGIVSGRESFAIISQIRLIDTRRLINKIAFLDEEHFSNTRKTIRDLF